MTEQASSDTAALRETLAAAATLGTARRLFELPHASGALGSALAHIDTIKGGEHALLSAAALVTSYERAGYRAPRAPEGVTVTPAEQDTLPVCSPAAAQHLLTLLSGRERVILTEWLTLLTTRGKRVPERLLPDLLEAGRHDASLQPLIRVAIGIRGRWLAAQHVDWHYASVAVSNSSSVTQEQATDVWQTGTRTMRLALLNAIRSVAPDSARDLIMSTWSSDPADERAAFLETLGSGLSMVDEPFLETMLDDRSKTVRKTAADLLARLPDSRLVQRMIARITPLLRWTPPGGARLLGLMRGKPGSIEVTLPSACDKEMARDGIDPKPLTQAIGERSTWLIQILRTIPPRYWEKQWQATPEQIVTAMNAYDEFSSVLKEAWTDAVRSYRDATWAETLLRIDPQLNALLPMLPIERQEALLLDVLHPSATAEQHTAALILLRVTHHQWSPALSRAALDVLLGLVKYPSNQTYYTLTNSLNEAAHHIPPTLLPEIEALNPGSEEEQGRWRNASERMLNTLRFRYEIDQALQT